VKDLKRTEEQLKDYIFDIFSKCRNETTADRLQVYYLDLCEQIFKWYIDYRANKTEKMGLEIVTVINRFIKEGNISKIPDDKDGFFKYLVTSLDNERKESLRKYNEYETIKIPKEKERKLREVKEFIRMKESYLGRKLTDDEQLTSISKWFKEQEYIDLWNATNVGSLSNAGSDDNKKLDIPDTHSDSPLEEFINKTDMEAVRKAVKSLLDKKQARSRDCYRALFTLYCVKEGITELYPILDQEIIDSYYKDGKKPTQYEIYQKYHSDVDQEIAGVQASTNLHEFLDDLKTCLKNQ